MITTRVAVDAEARREALSKYHVPGERVRVNRRAKLPGEDAEAARVRQDSYGDRELLITEFIFDADGSLKYRFEGVEGEHDVGAFDDVESMSHHLGVLLGIDGEVWLVPLATDHRSDRVEVTGSPVQVDPDLDRLATYWVGPYGPGELLAEVTEAPWMGEFVVSDPTGGPCKLKGSPWRSDASEAELRSAREAVEDHLDVLAMSVRSLH